MSARQPTVGFSWEFLDEIARWALTVAALCSAVALFVGTDVRFAAACMTGAVIDVALVRMAARRARTEIESDTYGGTAAAILLGGRLVVKALLLLAALALPWVFDFAGMVAGVLMYDFTLAVVGSVIALRRGFTQVDGSR